MVEINLLPWRDSYRRQQWKNGCVFYGVSLSVVLLILLCIQWVFSSEINLQRHLYREQLTLMNDHQIDEKVDVVWVEKIKQQRIMQTIFNRLLYGNANIIIHDFSRKDKNSVIKGYSSALVDINNFMRELLTIQNMDFVRLISLKQVAERVEFEILAVER